MMTEAKNSAKLWKVMSGVLVSLNLVLGLWAYPRLPEQVPSHWNAAGQVDGYTNAMGGAFLMPAIMLGLYALLWVLPLIDPKKENYQKMGRIYWISGFFITLVLTGINGFAIATALEYLNPNTWAVTVFINVLIGIIFIVLGNYMGKIRYNFTFGIRLPWTLASEEVWQKTHRFSGPLMFGAGIAMVIIAFLPVAWRMWLNLGVIFATMGVISVYSFLTYRQLKG